MKLLSLLFASLFLALVHSARLDKKFFGIYHFLRGTDIDEYMEYKPMGLIEAFQAFWFDLTKIKKFYITDGTDNSTYFIAMNQPRFFAYNNLEGDALYAPYHDFSKSKAADVSMEYFSTIDGGLLRYEYPRQISPDDFQTEEWHFKYHVNRENETFLHIVINYYHEETHKKTYLHYQKWYDASYVKVRGTDMKEHLVPRQFNGDNELY